MGHSSIAVTGIDSSPMVETMGKFQHGEGWCVPAGCGNEAGPAYKGETQLYF